MEGERKVILSALTSVGYIEYYIVSVYKVYVHGARVQRLRFYRGGGEGREIFLINGLRTPVYTCVHNGPPQTLILSKIITDENDARSKGMFAM